MTEQAAYGSNDSLLKMAQGDKTAFAVVYSKFGQLVFNTAMSYIKDSNVAEEITQQVFIKVWLKRTQFLQVDNPEGYFFTIARNTVYSHFRRLALERKNLANFPSAATHDHNDGISKLSMAEITTIVQSAIMALPPRQQQIYLMANESGLSSEQIANALDLARSTVKKHLELARRFIRDYVSRRLDGYTLIPILLCTPILLT